MTHKFVNFSNIDEVITVNELEVKNSLRNLCVTLSFGVSIA